MSFTKHPSVTPLKKVLSIACLALVGLTALQSNTMPAVAQGKSDVSPTALATELGLRSSDLELTTPESYRTNPVTAPPQAKSGSQSSSGVSDVVGTLSIQDFQGTQPTVYHTHASADGFRNYLATWYIPNFIYRDNGVGVWQYHDVYGGDNYDL